MAKLMPLCCGLLLWATTVYAESVTPRFALVPKATSNEFFIPSEQGCLDQAQWLGVECLYTGPEQADVRAQNGVLAELVAQRVDGIALSVIQSEFLLKRSILQAQLEGIPVVTFDSGFATEDLQRYPGLEVPYIGTDNFAMGQALGRRLRELKPEGGTLCMITGRPDTPNLSERIEGVRAALASPHPIDLEQPLAGVNGWREHPRCPFESFEDAERANRMLHYLLQAKAESRTPDQQVSAIINIGFWAQQFAGYEATMQQYKGLLSSRKVVVLFADVLPWQLPYIELGYSHGNIGQSPYDMGRLAIDTLYRLTQGVKVPAVQHTELIECRPGIKPSCHNLKLHSN